MSKEYLREGHQGVERERNRIYSGWGNGRIIYSLIFRPNNLYIISLEWISDIRMGLYRKMEIGKYYIERRMANYGGKMKNRK